MPRLLQALRPASQRGWLSLCVARAGSCLHAWHLATSVAGQLCQPVPCARLPGMCGRLCWCPSVLLRSPPSFLQSETSTHSVSRATSPPVTSSCPQPLGPPPRLRLGVFSCWVPQCSVAVRHPQIHFPAAATGLAGVPPGPGLCPPVVFQPHKTRLVLPSSAVKSLLGWARAGSWEEALG